MSVFKKYRILNIYHQSKTITEFIIKSFGISDAHITTIVRTQMINMRPICYIMFKVRKTMAVPKCKRGGESRSSSGVVLRRGDGVNAAGGDGAVGSRIDGPFGLAGRCGSAYCTLDAPLSSPHTLPCSVLASHRCFLRSHPVAPPVH